MMTAEDREIAIVFGVYINADADWRKLIAAQLNDLRRFGVLSACDLHVVVSNPSEVVGVAAFFDSLPIATKSIEFHNENKFEFPAIFQVWALANAAKYKYIGYLHTKGMSYAHNRRDKIEKALTRFTFSDWQKVFQVFETHPHVNKIGLFPGDHLGGPYGFIWYNFWWGRSRFLQNLPRPVETENRHRFESWLSLTPSMPTDRDCYSLYADDNKKFSGDEAGENVKLLRWRMRYGPFYRVRKMFAPLHKLRRIVVGKMRRLTSSISGKPPISLSNHPD
jgi:hypothetical protein